MKKIIALIMVCVAFALLLSGCSHSHKWKDATCKRPKRCTICGETDGKPLAHQWEDATCLNPKTCKLCSLSKGEPLGHEGLDWQITIEATCQQPGQSRGKCVRCDEVMEKELVKLEHTPGEWIIDVNATIYEKGRRIQKCIVCSEVLSEEEFELPPEEHKKAYKAACKKYKYTDIARSPAQYKGELAKFTGEVIQVQQSTFSNTISYVLRVNVTKNGSSYTYYTDTIYVTYTASKDDPRILDEDIITMYGELQGEKTYTTVLGSSVTIPLFVAEYIDIN